ncbi:hypothetical protein C356_05586 [Cryptococcus neoformans c45]|nr:hypothetical protein C356_05586 [Cryptococcus neoformans var. grubii c45]
MSASSRPMSPDLEEEAEVAVVEAEAEDQVAIEGSEEGCSRMMDRPREEGLVEDLTDRLWIRVMEGDHSMDRLEVLVDLGLNLPLAVPE